MAYCVDPTLQGMEPTQAEPAVDCVPPKAKPFKLRARHHTVLTLRNVGYPTILTHASAPAPA
jgi:hypothetical protein